MPATTAHFNGSVNLADAETVMREICSRLPAASLRRLTDGETGERINWVAFQADRLAATEAFEFGPKPDGPAGYGAMQRVRLTDQVDPEAIAWPDLGYAQAYGESFATFTGLQADGIVPGDVRMQLQYPTPIAGLSFVEPDDAPRVLESYRTALFADLGRALASLPHDKVAVQWDVAVEIGMLARHADSPDYVSVTPGLIACLAQVPTNVPVGMHLCYGDLGHEHFVQPESLALQVGLINTLVAQAPRPVDWFSITVPQNCSDAAFFAPLADLKAAATTHLCFGIVPYHPAEQAAGVTAAQIDHIDTYLAASEGGARDWAIGTECGMGRAARAEVPGLLDTYAEILTGTWR